MSLLQTIQDKGFTDTVFAAGRPAGGFKAANQHLIGNCPLCGKQGKLYVSLTKAVWDCKVCGHGGSWYDWVELTEGLGRREAMVRLAGIAGIALSREIEEQANTARVRASVLEAALRIMQDWLLNGHDERSVMVREYLGRRGYSREEMIGMGLGAYASREMLTEMLQREGHSLADIKAAGLLSTGFGQTHELAIMWRRASGEAEQLTCRSLTGHEPKYKNTTGASKDGVLGLGLARHKQWAVLVESQLDSGRLCYHGIPTLACGGTSIKSAQAEAIISSGIKQLILLFDQHEAPGRNATVKAVKQLCHQRLQLFVASLPEGFKDPDEFVTAQGIAALQPHLDAAVPAAAWLGAEMARLPEGFTPRDRELAIQHVREASAIWAWATDRQQFLAAASAALGLPVWQLGPAAAAETPADTGLERCVLATAMAFPGAAADEVAQSLRAADFSHPGNRRIFMALSDTKAAGLRPDVETLRRLLEERGWIEQAGGVEYLRKVAGSSRHIDDLPQHINMLLSISKARLLQALSLEAAAKVGAGGSCDELIIQTRRALDDLADIGIDDKDALAGDVMMNFATRGRTMGYTTGFERLDECTEGFSPGLHVWAGFSTTGKSRIACYGMLSAKRAGAKIGILSLDMRDELTKYLATTAAALNGHPVDWRGANPEQLAWIHGLINDVLFAAEGCSRLSQITAMYRRWARQGVKVVLIDQFQCVYEYMQALNGRSPNRGLIDATTQQIKDVSNDLGISTLGLHQINREGAVRPTITDLKDTNGFLERASSVVLLSDLQRSLIKVHGAFKRGNNGHCAAPTKADWKAHEEGEGDLFFKPDLIRPVVVDCAKARNPMDAEMVQFNFATGVRERGVHDFDQGDF